MHSGQLWPRGRQRFRKPSTVYPLGADKVPGAFLSHEDGAIEMNRPFVGCKLPQNFATVHRRDATQGSPKAVNVIEPGKRSPAARKGAIPTAQRLGRRLSTDCRASSCAQSGLRVRDTILAYRTASPRREVPAQKRHETTCSLKGLGSGCCAICTEKNMVKTWRCLSLTASGLSEARQEKLLIGPEFDEVRREDSS